MLLDYLETHLVDHCNLNCKGCGHFSPLSEENFTSLTTFKRDFSRLKDLFENISIIRLMGGEPLLHPDVFLFSEFSRAMFPRAHISLVTNGVLLLKQLDTFWERCARDEIEIQISEYPIKLDFEAMREKGKSAGVKVGTGWVASSFLKWINIAGDSDPAVVFPICQSMFKCPFLRDGKISKCGFPVLAPIFNKRFPKDITASQEDTIDIFGDTTASGILEFLGRPSQMCRWCSTNYSTFPWGVSAKRMEEWISIEEKPTAHGGGGNGLAESAPDQW